MAVDQQAKVVEKYLKLKDLGDPAKLGKLLGRFAVMYDLKNSGQSIVTRDSPSCKGPGQALVRTPTWPLPGCAVRR